MKLPLIGCRFCKVIKFFGESASIAEVRTINNQPVLFIGGSPLTDNQLTELKMEVDLLKQTGLWKIITSTVTQHAIELGIKQAKDFDQTMFAKSMLHVVGIMEGVFKAIEEEKERRKKQ